MNTFVLLSQIAGGVLLFLVGMQMLSQGLRQVAGDRLRAWLTVATRSRLGGLTLGTTAGVVAHSSAATAMTVGFVHAGLLGLAGAVPVMLGANLGTTFSMQLISLRLSDYALAAVALGGFLRLVVPRGRWHAVGRAVLGFGLLFLGMKLSGGAIEPYRDALSPLLGGIDGTTVAGLAGGVLLSTAVTALVQSSGAVIGMTFVLAGSGVFTSLTQTYPIVLGAHIGTTITALIASVGTSPDARRAALANTFFNVFNAVVGMAGAAVLIPQLQRTSSDLVHQTANTHTAIMLLGVVIALPMNAFLVRIMRWVVRSSEPERPGSWIESSLVRLPEDALVAAIREVGRGIALCRESFAIVIAGIEGGDLKRLRRVDRNETSIDEIKTNLRGFLRTLAHGYLSRRQALLVRALDRCAVELERVGDHVDVMADLIRSDGKRGLEGLDESGKRGVLRLAQLASEVLARLEQGFDPEDQDLDARAGSVLEARSAYLRDSAPIRNEMQERLSRHEVPAHLVLLFSDCAVALERIVRHCAVMAQEQRHPYFHIKTSKIGRPAGRPGSEVSGN